MPSNKYILAIDQGTSSTKSIIFDEAGKAIARASEPLKSNYLSDGFVEQDAEEIYQNVLTSVSNCIKMFTDNGGDVQEIICCGISNQRETFVVWDVSGKPLHPAIVWQCKRSLQVCEKLKMDSDLEQYIRYNTGLVIDPYFSATKLMWLKDNNEVVGKSIENGSAFFGTIDAWILYKLTHAQHYATDYTNASRTMLFNLHTLQWDLYLIEKLGLIGIQLPQLQPSASFFGTTDLNGILPLPIVITAMIGDSHAAAFGEGCFEAGTAKATLGTGCSILMNIGDKPVASKNGMVTTICWSTADIVDYALEGVIVSCGATIEWLKNELMLFKDSFETEKMACSVSDNGGVYLIPSFSGLGSPHWQMDRRASISGMNFATTKNHIVRAALESIAYQIRDVVTAMENDASLSLKELMTDGGITANQFVLQFIADQLNKDVLCIPMPDISALGAAYLAGLKSGLYENLAAIKKLNSDKKRHHPIVTGEVADKNYEGWKQAILRC